MAVKFSNNAVSTLTGNISAGATSFTVNDASSFPTLGTGDWTYVTIGTEVIKITAISGNTFTCVATSNPHSTSDRVELRVTSELFNDVAADTTNVAAAGALMDSELTNITAVKAIDQGVATTDDVTFNTTTTKAQYLEALTNTLTGTAVDTYIYIPALDDTDGGAWRKRCQHTSWYNEELNTATRGATREFPSIVGIVAESAKVTLYDMSSGDPVSWMVFTSDSYQNMLIENEVTCLAIKNATLAVGHGNTGYDLNVVNFLSDSAKQYGAASINETYLGNISERNSAKGWGGINTLPDIIDRKINDVAITVLPNAPIDSATGLPVPTIACLVGESLVEMADGTQQRIDQVEVGSIVKTLEGEHEVLNWWDQGVKDVIELEFDGGQKLVCTTDHKIRTTDGWVEAGQLNSSHEVIGL